MVAPSLSNKKISSSVAAVPTGYDTSFWSKQLRSIYVKFAMLFCLAESLVNLAVLEFGLHIPKQLIMYMIYIYIYANYAWEVKLFPVFEFSQFPTKEVFIWPTRYSSIHHDALPELVPAFVLGTKNMTSRPANTISSVQRLQLSSPTAVGTSNIKAFSFDKVGWEVITCYRSDMYMYKQTRVIF